MLLSKKVTHQTTDSMSGLEATKRVLVFLVVVFAIAYSFMSLAFGIKFIITVLLSCLFAREVEILFLTHQRKMNRQAAKEHIYFTKPEVSGLILALLLPVATPIYITIIGISFGIFIGKMAFGGYSFNVFNIAIAARVFIEASWQGALASVKPVGLTDYFLSLIFKTDYSLSNSLLTNNINFSHFTTGPLNYLSLVVAGALVLGFIYLCINGVAKFSNLFWPIIFFMIIYIALDLNAGFILGFITTPLVLLVLIFGLNDPYTTAGSSIGRFVLASIFVVVASFMMLTKNNGYGILYALLFMNMLVPLVDDKLPLKSNMIKPLIFSIVLITGSALVLQGEAPDTKTGASQNVKEPSKEAPDTNGGASPTSKETNYKTTQVNMISNISEVVSYE